MEALASRLSALLPGIVIQAGEALCWSPKTGIITYRLDDASPENLWGLLHEAGHAKLQHTTYASDMELLLLEVAAWEEALTIGRQLGSEINQEHIQDCLDTYRDWLHQRSTCPRCGIVSFQASPKQYRCYNCAKNWAVSSSRLCRPYRLGRVDKKNRPEIIPQAVFRSKITYIKQSS